MLAFGVMFTGCGASTVITIGGAVLGGIIGHIIDDVFILGEWIIPIGLAVGGIIGYIVSNIIFGSSSSSSRPTGCSDCKYWDNSSHQGKCNLTGDLYMRDGCSLKPR